MPRATAYEVLRSGSPTPLREVDRVAERHGLDARDRGLVRRLVGTEVRRRATLRALVQAFTRRKPSPELSVHLRLGFVQIFFLDQVPDHAAVSESVRAVADTVALAKGRFVNGVLREALRARREGHCGDPRRDLVGRPWHLDRDVFRDPVEHPYLWAEDALDLPAHLAKRWVARLGREAAFALAEDCLVEPRLSLRVVRAEPGDDVAARRAELAAELAAAEVETEPGAHPAVLLAPAAATEAALATAAFREGRATVQGETALRAAELVEARPGERVLEVGAAPGGKCAVLAEAGARVVAVDDDLRRLARLAPGLARLGLAGRGSARAAAGATALAGAPFDAALVDAPCSNTGVLAARPEARWRFGPTALRELTALQTRLLAETATRVRPGGRLVYSTCSLEPEENAQLVRAFLETTPGWRLEAEHEHVPSPRTGPGPVDGGYAVRLRREG